MMSILFFSQQSVAPPPAKELITAVEVVEAEANEMRLNGSPLNDLMFQRVTWRSSAAQKSSVQRNNPAYANR